VSEPTDINKFRNRAEESPIFHIDGEGVRWNNYVADYTDSRGIKMNFNVWATSYEDADARLKSIGETGVVKGVLFEEILA
jgi:hypothetical protein